MTVDLRALIVRIASEPTRVNEAAVATALPGATLYLTFTGAPASWAPGQRHVVGAVDQIAVKRCRLANGMEMILTSAAPPKSVEAGETVVTMTGVEVIDMVLKMPPIGLVVRAEDERDSWTALTHERLESLRRK